MAVIKEVPLKWTGYLQIKNFGHFSYRKVVGGMTYTKFIGSVVEDDNGELPAGMLCVQFSSKNGVYVIPFGMRVENPHGKITDKIPLEDHLSDCWWSVVNFLISEAELERLKNKSQEDSEDSAYIHFSKIDYKEDTNNEQ